MTRPPTRHHGPERHRSGRAAWLRAGVLGANDGLISTASLIVGVAGASSARATILVAGIAGLTAGALSMAAGEFVSVSSQRDTEQADLQREREELEAYPQAEFAELCRIYENRGLSPELARQVALELSQADLLRVHARDELGIDPDRLADPLQASLVSALSFLFGALVPILVVAISPAWMRVATTMVVTMVGLVILGLVGAQMGGAPPGRAAVRVFIGGTLALAISLGIGNITGSVF